MWIYMYLQYVCPTLITPVFRLCAWWLSEKTTPFFVFEVPWVPPPMCSLGTRLIRALWKQFFQFSREFGDLLAVVPCFVSWTEDFFFGDQVLPIFLKCWRFLWCSRSATKLLRATSIFRLWHVSRSTATSDDADADIGLQKQSLETGWMLEHPKISALWCMNMNEHDTSRSAGRENDLTLCVGNHSNWSHCDPIISHSRHGSLW